MLSPPWWNAVAAAVTWWVFVVGPPAHDVPTVVECFSTASSPTRAGGGSSSYSENVYFDQYTAGQRLDQDAYTSPLFWEEVDAALRKQKQFGSKDAAARARFETFCENLRTGTPGQEITLPSGQQVLTQYRYPGLDEGDATAACDGVVRTAYPAERYDELKQLQRNLRTKVQPVAREELADLLRHKPLVDDDGDGTLNHNDDEGGGESWQRAAWYGWQYLNLRGAKRNMPRTARALRDAMGSSGPAHRFVGLSRQKADCEGVLHSDGRNYMLSTLTPVRTPPRGHCGIVVDGQDRLIHDEPVVLDNTFPHYIYNTHDHLDRFCIMSECYHPALTPKERDAIATLFAVKDRFTVNELQLAPWGYDDDDLLEAMNSGAVNDLNFWKDVAYVPKKNKKPRKKAAGGGGFGK